MNTSITASILYDFLSCPHRVAMDLYEDPLKQDEPNPFLQLLWEKGTLFEKELIENLKIPFLDLSSFKDEEKERFTLEAMQNGEPLIYSGRIQEGELLGIPDLLRREPGGYIAGDIKSGAAEEGPEDLSTPKKHYAVQLALYTDILERKGMSAGRHAFIWDIHGNEVKYDFNELFGKKSPRTLWQDYQECLAAVRSIVGDDNMTQPAYSSLCKLCHWRSTCMDRLEKGNDLTLIPELGRSRRDAMIDHVKTVSELSESNPESFIMGKKTVFPGIGPNTLMKFYERAKLQTSKESNILIRSPVKLPDYELELFFDIEVDPMRDICYLHGFVERYGHDNSTENYAAFFAEEPTPEAEKTAFYDAWQYMQKSRPFAIYYYSKYERTIYRKLQEKYPDICTIEQIEELFNPAHAIDLYNDVVRKNTEWPTRDYSIKTLANFLGFNWRDSHPSGAASIEWFDRWVKTGNPKLRQRILDYNEDDCIATRVLLDGIRQLSQA